MPGHTPNERRKRVLQGNFPSRVRGRVQRPSLRSRVLKRAGNFLFGKKATPFSAPNAARLIRARQKQLDKLMRGN